jgi:hypothetical protein
MSQAGTERGTIGAPASSATWDRYYKEASRRRRALGSPNRRLREEKRRRRNRERIGISISALFVGALTLFFYMVLNR